MLDELLVSKTYLLIIVAILLPTTKCKLPEN